MQGSLRELLAKLIDYAGLFPPANLPLDEALRNYADHTLSSHSWMLSRFICPADRLAEIEAHRDLLPRPGAKPWRFAVLARGGESLEQFLELLLDDVCKTRKFCEDFEGAAIADLLEVRLPSTVVAAGEEMVAELTERAAAIISTNLQPHYEIGFDDGEPSLVAAALAGLKKFNDRWASRSYQSAGAKIRTGGVEASAFPSTRQLAFFIGACRNLGLRFKATAGLHHPLRHFNKTVNTKMHGFLNVFVAAALSFAGRVDLQGLVSVLECESIDEFEFGDETLRCKEYTVELSAVIEARERFGMSFGSCSFEEPIQDLEALGLL